MRIAKLTIDGYYNYGNLLQNYALQQILLNYADHVDTIWHEKVNFLPFIGLNFTWKEYIKYFLNWKQFRTFYCQKYLGAEMVRQGKNREWSKHNIRTRTDVKELKDIADCYDYFVVGSDQVWNPYFGDLKNNFLNFAPYEKRIAYAASIATPEIPLEKQDIYEKGLRGMKYISMREEEGAQQVEKITGRKVPVVADPTMLLSLQEWKKVSRQPAWFNNQQYILTYFLGKRPDDTIRKIANREHLEVINLLDLTNYDTYVTSVDEFIWSVEHAGLVYTDSFHGTVFSILFKRPFIVCDRVGDSTESKMSSRIDTLLQYFGLENRRGTKANGYQINNPLEIAYGDTEAVIQREKHRADEYLRKALGLA